MMRSTPRSAELAKTIIYLQVYVKCYIVIARVKVPVTVSAFRGRLPSYHNLLIQRPVAIERDGIRSKGVSCNIGPMDILDSYAERAATKHDGYRQPYTVSNHCPQ